MVAPEVVVVDRIELRIHRDDAGSGGIERDGLNRVPVDSSALDGGMHRLRERAHVIGVALRGVIGVFFLPMQRVLTNTRAKAAACAVEDGDANAQRTEINTGYDAHTRSSLNIALSLLLQPARPAPNWQRRDARNLARKYSAAIPEAWGCA